VSPNPDNTAFAAVERGNDNNGNYSNSKIRGNHTGIAVGEPTAIAKTIIFTKRSSKNDICSTKYQISSSGTAKCWCLNFARSAFAKNQCTNAELSEL